MTTFNEEQVLFNGNEYGELSYSEERNVWVLWVYEIQDGVDYFEDLDETKDTIKEELEA